MARNFSPGAEDFRAENFRLRGAIEQVLEPLETYGTREDVPFYHPLTPFEVAQKLRLAISPRPVAWVEEWLGAVEKSADRLVLEATKFSGVPPHNLVAFLECLKALKHAVREVVGKP